MDFDTNEVETVIDFDPEVSDILRTIYDLNKIIRLIENSHELIFDCCETDQESDELKEALITNTQNHIVYLAEQLLNKKRAVDEI